MKYMSVIKGQIDFSLNIDGLIRFRGIVCIPNDEEIKNTLLKKAHKTNYSVHPRETKIIKDLQQKFWWPSLKKNVITFVSKRLTCQQVKVEHQRLPELLKPLNIP